MTTSKALGSILLITGLTFASIASTSAQTSLAFEAFETGGVSSPSDLDHIDLTALIMAAANGTTIRITNSSTIGDGFVTNKIPTVTKIFFEDQSNILGPISITGSSVGVSFVQNNGANLPGGNSISFVVDSAFTAVPPPSKNGLDPGEYITFLFEGTQYGSLLGAISSSHVRVGLHVQEIGEDGEDSAAYVLIPEPSAALLGCIGAFLLLRRRR